MNVKIDTKEKFTVITPDEVKLTAIMTGELIKMLHPYQQKKTPHLILNMKAINEIDQASGEELAAIQQNFYDNNCSFVFCCFQPVVEKMLDEIELLEILNVTVTESEAWDIVQMEEIEREVLGGEG